MVSGCAPLLPTALVLRIESDIPLTSVRVVARRGDASPFFTREFTIGPDFTLPGMLTLVPRDPSDPRAVVIEVDAVVAASGRTLRNLYVARFLPERTQMIRVALSGRCDAAFPLCPLRTENCTARGCEAGIPARTIDVTADRCARGMEQLTRCGDTCVDLQSDPDHCGRCERRCPGEVPWFRACVAGVCQYTEDRVAACRAAPSLTEREEPGRIAMTVPSSCEPFFTGGTAVYIVEIRPQRRSAVLIERRGDQDVALHAHPSCETISESCTNVASTDRSNPATVVLANNTGVVQRRPVSVTTRAGASGSFVISARDLPYADNAVCDGARRLTLGVTEMGDTADGNEPTSLCNLGFYRLYYRVTVPPNQVRRVTVQAPVSQPLRLAFGANCTEACGRSDRLTSGTTGVSLDFPNFDSVARDRIFIVASDDGTPFRYSLATTSLPVASNAQCANARLLERNVPLDTSSAGGGPPTCGVNRSAVGTVNPSVFFRAIVPPRSSGLYYAQLGDSSHGSMLHVACDSSTCPGFPLPISGRSSPPLRIVNSTDAPQQQIIAVSGRSSGTLNFTIRFDHEPL